MKRSPVAIIGAGPAGFSAALWLRNLAIDFHWFDAHGRVGGTLLRVGNRIDTLVAGRSFASGIELADALEQQRTSLGIPPPQSRDIAEIVADESRGWRLHLADDSTVCADHVVLATGTRPRLLELPNESALMGRGVEISVTRNLPRYAGSDAVVVGGGDAAAEGALLLADACPRVWLVHRSDHWRAQDRFMNELRARENVTILEHRRLVALNATDRGALASVTLDTGQVLPATGCFVRVGVAPCIPPIRTSLSKVPAQTADGYVAVDPDGRTSIDRLWACGDLTGSTHQSVAWASGQAARLAWVLATECGSH